MTQDKIIYVSGDDSGDFNVPKGENSHSTINAAIQYATKNGYNTVYLKGNFTYWIDDTINMASNLRLTGDSTAIIKLVAKAGWPVQKPLIGPNNISFENIEICGFTIDGNHDGNYDAKRNKNQVFPCVNKGLGYYNLINFNKSTNILVHDMTLQNGHGDGLRSEDSEKVYFYNNIVRLLGHDAVYFIRCTECESHDNNVRIRTNSGSRANDCTKAKIYNNIITAGDTWDSGNPGIQVERKNKSTIDVEVFNNIIYHSFGPAIWLICGTSVKDSGKSSVKVHHNIIYDCGTNPVLAYAGGIINFGISGATIDSNVIDGCYGHGIACMGGTDTSKSVFTGIVMYVRNNIIVNTVRRNYSASGTGYGIQNRVTASHKIVAEYNDVWNNIAGDYKGVSSVNSISADPLFVSESEHDYHLQSKAGHWTPDGYVKDKETSPCIGIGDPSLVWDKGEILEIGRYRDTAEASLQKTIYEIGTIKNNRIKSSTPTSNYSKDTYFDVGTLNSSTYRDLIWVDLSEFSNNKVKITKATLSLYWYYPVKQTRTYDTIVEIYRPAVSWDSEKVSWNCATTEKWKTAGGDWLDANEVTNGSTPFATLTFKKGTVPTNSYYEFDVTELVQKYIDGTYLNTGFFVKAKTEKDNYIAFYSINAPAKTSIMKLDIEYDA